MLNLLPQDHKEQVRGEYLRRFFTVSLGFFSLVCISFGVAIFPAYSLTRVRNKIAEENIASIKASTVAKDKNTVLNTIKDLETKMKVIALVPGDRSTDSINKVLDLKTKGVSIKSISYVKKEDSSKQVVVEGEALSRADLITFSKSVKASTWGISSDIPLSNLASEHNIPFSITLTASSTVK